MFDEKLDKIIESFESQNRSSPETNRPVKETDFVNLSFADLCLLASIFSEVLPEEVKLFADALSGKLKGFSNLELSITEKTEKETEVSELFERNKNSIAYLNSLNRILIVSEYDRTLLEELNGSYKFSSYQDPDYPSGDYYIEKMAESCLLGNNSDSIQYLLQTKNNTFLEWLGFIENVKTAIKLTERERLKKKMQGLDEWEAFDLPESEIKSAIAQSERERLKEIMRKLDFEGEKNRTHFGGAAVLPEYEKPRHSARIVPIEKNKFAWKRYAVAAGIIGLITFATVLVYNNKKASSDIAHDKSNISDSSKNILNRDPEKLDPLASNNLDTIKKILTVRKEDVMGFAEKQENITVYIYRINESESDQPEEKRRIDSLRKFNNSYTFKNNNLFIYLDNRDQPELYKLDNTYYLKIAATYYYIRPSGKPTQPNKVTDRNILARIDRINYQQDNK